MKKILIIAMSMAITQSLIAGTKHFTPELLWSMGRVSSPYASADGSKVVYSVTTFNIKDNKSQTIIKQTDIASKQSVKLGKGSVPKYIKGGDEITFIAADSKGTSQLWKMKTDGTERTQISFCDLDVEDYSFSPDETKVILVHPVKKLSEVGFQTFTDLPKSTARITENLMYRHWDEWVDCIPHPFVANYDGQKVADEKDILEGEPYESPMRPFGGAEQLCWSPDSKQIAYTCRKKTGRDYSTSTDSDIFLYTLEDGTTKNLCKPEGYVSPICDYTLSLAEQPVNHQNGDFNVGYDTNPQFSPNGKYITWQSMKRDGFESDRNRLCLYEVKTGKKTYITESFDSNVDSYTWATDNKKLYFNGVWHGETHIYQTNLKGEVVKLTEGQYDYTSVQLCGKSLLCGRQSMCESTDLYLVTPIKGKTSKVEQVTDENNKIKSEVAWGTVEARWSKTVDGKDMLTWIILPPNFDKNKKYPTLLFCEGGPQSPVSQFWSFRWNMMIMAANGYVVVAPNRRGLPGFGSEWNDEISTNYGGHCMDDLLSAIDDAVMNLPYVDKDRLGCVGASFGGFSVYYLAGNHHKRFKAFIAHDGIYNLEQQYVETEENWFTNWDLGGAPWNEHSSNASTTQKAAIHRSFAASPHRFVDKWDTPILCIHGSRDYRIVDSQTMSAFNAAKLRGVEAKLFICPDENHWVLKAQNGIAWQRTFFGWLDKYLK